MSTNSIIVLILQEVHIIMRLKLGTHSKICLMIQKSLRFLYHKT